MPISIYTVSPVRLVARKTAGLARTTAALLVGLLVPVGILVTSGCGNGRAAPLDPDASSNSEDGQADTVANDGDSAIEGFDDSALGDVFSDSNRHDDAQTDGQTIDADAHPIDVIAPDAQDNCPTDGMCHGGVYKVCENGERKVRDCKAEGMLCDVAKGGCVERCKDDTQCKDSNAVDGQYCRGDGRCAPKIFETVWEITSTQRTLTLPYCNDYEDAKCDFTVLWGDENAGNDFSKGTQITDCEPDENRTHTYENPGTYHVKIIGVYNGWGQPCMSCTGKEFLPMKHLKAIKSFGPVGISSRAFYDVGNIELPQDDIPDASQWTIAYYLFDQAHEFNQRIGHWDTSNVTDMYGMFQDAESFNQPIGNWDTANVMRMGEMFAQAAAFNQPIGNWDTSNVLDTAGMFMGATSFNQPIDNWDMSNNSDMSGMFHDASSFNQPLNKWNTSQLTRSWGMFYAATKFNQTLSKWDMRKNVDLRGMFEAAKQFDQDLAWWHLNPNTDLHNMFKNSGISKINYCKLISLPVWDVNISSVGIKYDCDK